MKTRFVIIIALLLSLSQTSCAMRPRVGAPWMEEMLYQGPEGPGLFKQGWRDGCETGISSTSNHLHKFFYKFKQDHQLARNPEYYTGWRVAYQFCMRYVFQYLKREII